MTQEQADRLTELDNKAKTGGPLSREEYSEALELQEIRRQSIDTLLSQIEEQKRNDPAQILTDLQAVCERIRENRHNFELKHNIEAERMAEFLWEEFMR